MIKFSMRQLRKRILQPTHELMAEVAASGGDGSGVVTYGDGDYALRTTGAPILAVAHCDSVDCGSDHFHAQNGVVWSSRLDDRLGVYVILDVLPRLGIECDVLLTDNEERGRSTAANYWPEKHGYNWMFQFDRRGTDAVTYDYDRMISHVRKHFTHSLGSFSDISSLEHLGIGGVNIGVGYYEEHTLGSYAVLDDLADQLRRFVAFHGEFRDKYVPHEERPKPLVKYSKRTSCTTPRTLFKGIELYRPEDYDSFDEYIDAKYGRNYEQWSERKWQDYMDEEAQRAMIEEELDARWRDKFESEA